MRYLHQRHWKQTGNAGETHTFAGLGDGHSRIDVAAIGNVCINRLQNINSGSIACMLATSAIPRAIVQHETARQVPLPYR
jgi:hypothetical protein